MTVTQPYHVDHIGNGYYRTENGNSFQVFSGGSGGERIYYWWPREPKNDPLRKAEGPFSSLDDAVKDGMSYGDAQK